MTPKTLPDPDELKRSLLEKFEEKRKLIIGIAILAIVGVVGIVLFVSLGESARQDEWYDLVNARPPIGSAAQLEKLAEVGSKDFRANALLQLAQDGIMKSRHDEAIAALTRIEEEFATTYVASLPSPDERRTLIRLLKERLIADREWKKQHGYDEPEPELSRLALVETSEGAFWIGFFVDFAPDHVENFVARAKAGDFNGTKVYGVTPTRLLLGGANTKDDDDKNDKDDPAGTTWQDPERGRYRIEQVRGMVSSVITDDGESKDRITITLATARDLNKRQTIFGKVLTDRHPGMEALDEIANADTYGTSDKPEYRSEGFIELADHPMKAIEILRVSIWAGDQIEGGHSWDTKDVTIPKEEEKAPEKEEKPEDMPEKDPEETKPEGE